MPKNKMKTNRATAKRMRVTGSGKIVHKVANAAHLYKSKSKPRQVRLKGMKPLKKSDMARARRLLGK
jgi:large subunit ribosomal protein L35